MNTKIKHKEVLIQFFRFDYIESKKTEVSVKPGNTPTCISDDQNSWRTLKAVGHRVEGITSLLMRVGSRKLELKGAASTCTEKVVKGMFTQTQQFSFN